MIYEAIVWFAVAYVLLYKLNNYGYYNNSGFPQYRPNGIYFSCKIWHGLLKQFELSCDIKVFKNLKKS